MSETVRGALGRAGWGVALLLLVIVESLLPLGPFAASEYRKIHNRNLAESARSGLSIGMPASVAVARMLEGEGVVRRRRCEASTLDPGTPRMVTLWEEQFFFGSSTIREATIIELLIGRATDDDEPLVRNISWVSTPSRKLYLTDCPDVIAR